MVTSNLKIASVAIGTGGIITGTGVGIYSYLNKSTENKELEKNISKEKAISEWLLENNFLMLASDVKGDQSQWKTNWDAFTNEHSSKTNLDSEWNIQEWTTKKSDKQNVPADFKTNCSNNGKSKIENGEGQLYEAVKKYCTKPKSRDS